MTAPPVPSVREATLEDAPAIHRLLTEMGRPAATPPSATQEAVVRAHIADRDCQVLVAELDGGTAGFACLWIRLRLGWETPEAWIPDLVVAPQARRMGVARALLDACRARAVAGGCHLLRLECGHHRTAAHALYRAAGFRDGGVSYQFRLTPPTP